MMLVRRNQRLLITLSKSTSDSRMRFCGRGGVSLVYDGMFWDGMENEGERGEKAGGARQRVGEGR